MLRLIRKGLWGGREKKVEKLFFSCGDTWKSANIQDIGP